MKEINDKMDKELQEMIKNDTHVEGDIYWTVTGEDALKKMHEYDDIDWEWSGEYEEKAKQQVWPAIEEEIWHEQQDETYEERVEVTYEWHTDTITGMKTKVPVVGVNKKERTKEVKSESDSQLGQSKEIKNKKPAPPK